MTPSRPDPLTPRAPMMATPAVVLPSGPEWTFEVKWDGYRTIAVKQDDQVVLRSRNLKDVTLQYPGVVAAIRSVRAKTAVVDGELVAIDEHGQPSFQALHHQSASAVVMYAFDLLYVNGRDLIHEPIERRRAALARAATGSALFVSEPLPGTPADIERAVRSLGLEGIVAKRRASRYEPGRRSHAWVKVKFSRRQEFVVGGYKPAGASFDSLLVGYYEGARLTFAGKVRAGLTPRIRAELLEALEPVRVARCPFVNLPSSRTSHWGEGIAAEEMTTLRWVKPVVVVEVSFTEWTRELNLRHAAFVGIRVDKPPRQVRREVP